MRYTQYNDFYNQSITLPIKGVRGKKIDAKMLGTALVLIVISAVIVSFFAPGKTIFGIQKIWVIIALAGVLIFLSTKIDTGNYPFFLFVFSIVKFAGTKLRKKGAKVGFQAVDRPLNKITYKWSVKYRDIVDDGKKIDYFMHPLSGIVKQIKGMSMHLREATEIRFNPITKQIKIKNGNFDRLENLSQDISKVKPVNIQVGRGNLKFIYQKRKLKGVYTPEIQREEE